MSFKEVTEADINKLEILSLKLPSVSDDDYTYYPTKTNKGCFMLKSSNNVFLKNVGVDRRLSDEEFNDIDSFEWNAIKADTNDSFYIAIMNFIRLEKLKDLCK